MCLYVMNILNCGDTALAANERVYSIPTARTSMKPTNY